jgi:hypothetical protein
MDDQVSPLDALQILNVLNARGASELPVPPPALDLPPPLLDVTGDDRVSPLDALQVINYLLAGTAGEGEDGGSFVVEGLDGSGTPRPCDWAPHAPTDVRAFLPVRWLRAAGADLETWGARGLFVGSTSTSHEAATLAATLRMLRKRDRLIVPDSPENDAIFGDWPEQLVDVRFRS